MGCTDSKRSPRPYLDNNVTKNGPENAKVLAVAYSNLVKDR